MLVKNLGPSQDIEVVSEIGKGTTVAFLIYGELPASMVNYKRFKSNY